MNDPITYEIQIPRGLSPEEEQKYIQDYINKQRQKSNYNTNAFQAATAGLTQGLTGDWGDELAGIVSSLFTGQPREKVQEERSAMYRAAQEQHPLAYNLSYGLGALLPSLLTKNPAPISSALRGALGKAPLTGFKQAAVEGALQGAISGAGQAPRDELPGGLVFGTTVGGLGGLAAHGAMGLGRFAGDIYRNTISPNAAANVLSEAIEKAPGGFGAIERNIAEAKAAGQPITLADATPLGSKARGMLEGVLNRPGESNLRQQVYTLLTERAADAYERVLSKLTSILQKTPDATLAQAEIKKEIESELQPVFQKVLSEKGGDVIVDPKVLSILQERPSARIALQKAQRIMEDMGEPFQVLMEDGKLKGITLRTFDYVRKVLGDAAYQNIDLDTASSALKSQTVANRKILGNLMDAVREQFPEYGEALNAYSSIFRLRDAVELGSNAASKAGKYALEEFNKLETSAEKHAFAVGFFGKKLEKASGQRNPAKELYGSPLARKTTDAILSALKSSEVAEDFGRFLTRENEMLSLKGDLLGGSPTARRWSISNLFRITSPSTWLQAAEKKAVERESDNLIRLGLLSDPDVALERLKAAALERQKILEKRGLHPYAIVPLSRLGVSAIGKETYK